MAKTKSTTVPDEEELPLEPDPDPEETPPDPTETGEPPDTIDASGRLAQPEDAIVLEGLTEQTGCIIEFGHFTGTVYIEGGIDGEYSMIDPKLISGEDQLNALQIESQPLVLDGAPEHEIYKVDCTGLSEVRARAATVSGAGFVEMQAA